MTATSIASHAAPQKPSNYEVRSLAESRQSGMVRKASSDGSAQSRAFFNGGSGIFSIAPATSRHSYDKRTRSVSDNTPPSYWFWNSQSSSIASPHPPYGSSQWVGLLPDSVSGNRQGSQEPFSLPLSDASKEVSVTYSMPTSNRTNRRLLLVSPYSLDGDHDLPVTVSTVLYKPITWPGNQSVIGSSASISSTRVQDELLSNYTEEVPWVSLTLGSVPTNFTQDTTRDGLTVDSSMTFLMTETEWSLSRDGINVVAYTVVYILMGLLGLLSNALIVFVIVRWRSLRTSQNAIVANLCAADILITVTAVAATTAQLSHDFPPTTCYSFGFFMGIGPVVAVLTMVVISKTRYAAVTTILPMRVQASTVVAAITGVWIVSVGLTIPILFQAVVVEACEPYGCCFYFQTGIAYGVTFTVFGYIIPNVIVIQYYVRIFVFVRRSRRRIEDGLPQNFRKSQKGLAEIRMATQFIAICLFVNVCYIPVLLLMWIETPTRLITSHVIRGTVCVVYLVVPIANSVLYFLLNVNTRKELWKLLICLKSSS